jgi:hypothetical protein
MNIGEKFEQELSEEFGLQKVSGSGNKWYSRLDLFGQGARWSLKATSKKSLSISEETIVEAINACEGIGGDGSIPVWAFRIGSHDIISLRKEDFKSFQKGELKLIGDGVGQQVIQRRNRAATPSLFRDEC